MKKKNKLSQNFATFLLTPKRSTRHFHSKLIYLNTSDKQIIFGNSCEPFLKR